MILATTVHKMEFFSNFAKVSYANIYLQMKKDIHTIFSFVYIYIICLPNTD